ncbi:MAG: hypothetical protein AAGI22_23220 [Planctomycetota bacterium]
MNSRGEVLLSANLEGPGVTPVDERALFFGTPGSLTPIVRGGAQLSDLPGSVLLSVGKFAANRNGLVVFEALTAPVGTFDVSTSLWAWEPGLTEPFLVAQTGEPLPFGSGTKDPTLVTFLGGPGSQSGFGSQLNDSGVLLFEAAFDADATAGIYEVDLSDTGESIGTRYCTPAVANSTGDPGSLVVAGSSVVSENEVILSARDLPPVSFGFFLTSTTQAMTANPGGSQGVLCLGGSIGRYVGAGQILNSGGAGRFELTLDLTQTPTPNGFVAIQAGQTWNFQAWHRDSVGGNATSNFTDAVSVTFE